MTFLLSLPTCFAAGFCLLMSPALADPLTIYDSMVPFDAAGSHPLRLTAAALGSASGFTFKNDTVSFDGIAADQGVVRGALPGAYAAPIIDSAGDSFAGKYFSTGNTGSIDVSLAKSQRSLSLLWGSVDLSNQITLLENGQVVATVDGADIDPEANGFQGFGGSEYVLIDSALKFNEIEFSSAVPSFELAELRTGPADIPVHEPASLALFGTGLLGLVSLRRRF